MRETAETCIDRCSLPLLAVADLDRRIVKLLAEGIRIACSFAFTRWLFSNCEYISDFDIIQLRKNAMRQATATATAQHHREEEL